MIGDRTQHDPAGWAPAGGNQPLFRILPRLWPNPLREDVARVAAFCQWTANLEDPADSAGETLERLASWRQELSDCYDGTPGHPVFLALRPTIEKHGIPRKLFEDLIEARVGDQTVTRYRTWDDVVDHAARYANPIGRLLLAIAGHDDAQRQRLADATSTALQLTRFWQNVQRDMVYRDRVYIPDDVARRHGLDIGTLVKVGRSAFTPRDEPPMKCRCADRTPVGITALLPAYRATLHELVGRTRERFQQGRALWPLLDDHLRPQAKLLTLDGEAILRRIERQRYDTLTCRLQLGWATQLGLMLRVLPGTILPGTLAARSITRRRSRTNPDGHAGSSYPAQAHQ